MPNISFASFMLLIVDSFNLISTVCFLALSVQYCDVPRYKACVCIFLKAFSISRGKAACWVWQTNPTNSYVTLTKALHCHHPLHFRLVHAQVTL